jgi:hypothetical protein
LPYAIAIWARKTGTGTNNAKHPLGRSGYSYLTLFFERSNIKNENALNREVF